MSSQSIALNTGQQAIIHTDLSRIFVRENRYEYGNYVNNSTYNPITLLAGTLMGRISASGILVPLKSDAGDGSQFPVGILAKDMIIDSGANDEAPICVAGDVVKDKVIFTKIGDAMETVVSSRRLSDRIAADTVGIKLVSNTEMSAYDNQ